MSLIDRVIFQKRDTKIILIINKEFSLAEVTLIDSGVDNMNCIQEILIPLKYYEKSSQRARTRLLRTTMVTTMMMVMRTIVLAHLVMTRCLLYVLTPSSLVTKCILLVIG